MAHNSQKRVAKTVQPQSPSIDTFALLGFGTALNLLEEEREVARLTASSIASALCVKFGAVVLAPSQSRSRVYGKLNGRPFSDLVSKEIADLRSTVAEGNGGLTPEFSREIEVRGEALPHLAKVGLVRLLLANLRTVERAYGFILAGTTSEQTFTSYQSAALATLASQAAMALHRIELNAARLAQEAALRESEKRFRMLIEHAGDALFLIDPNGKIIEVNQQACKSLGYTQQELLKKALSDFSIAADPEKVKKHWLQLEPPAVLTLEGTHQRKDGSTFPVEVSVRLFEHEGRELFLALARDVSERKKAEAALQESEQRLSCILESAMDAIIAINEALQIVLFNKAAEKVFGCSAKDVKGQPLVNFLSESFKRLISNYISGEAKGGRGYMWVPEGLTAKRKSGEEFPVEATISTVEADCQGLYTIILRDTNERKKAEAELNKLQLQNVYLQEEIKSEYFGDIIGSSPAMKAVFTSVGQVSGTDSTVLLSGETGTGKELVARAIHKLSKRRDSVLVKVNCGALPEGLVESELFGHEKGAFTGAMATKKGRFELADGGTLFLDEVGELPLATQIKLLQVLQEQEFERVGGMQSKKVDVRVIAATNRDLEEAVKLGAFRADLYYRLNIFPIQIPPLLDRMEDVPLLANYFIRKFSRRIGKRIDNINDEAMNRLMNYGWPGNVRELANVLERAVILCGTGVVELEHIGISIQDHPKDVQISSLEDAERQHIMNALKKTGGVVGGPKGAANLLGINRSTLLSRMRKLGIDKAQDWR